MKAAVALLGLVACSWAQEKKDPPKNMAVAPVVLTPASEVTLKFRGLKLDTATEVRFPAAPDLKAELGEKKAATVGRCGLTDRLAFRGHRPGPVPVSFEGPAPRPTRSPRLEQLPGSHNPPAAVLRASKIPLLPFQPLLPHRPRRPARLPKHGQRILRRADQGASIAPTRAK